MISRRNMLLGAAACAVELLHAVPARWKSFEMARRSYQAMGQAAKVAADYEIANWGVALPSVRTSRQGGA